MSDLPPISVEEYRAQVLADIAPLPPGPMPLLDALGLTAAEDRHALVSLPGFDNSAMDGYAVAFADVATATPDAPVVLPVVGENAAGAATLLALPPGTAAKVMTGAPIPVGADAVVPYEQTDRGLARVRIDQAPSGPGRHIRRAGDDVVAGDLVVTAGTVLNARHLGLLAATGHGSIAVRPRPRVVVLSTGSELREPGQTLAADAIYDSNSFLLAAAAKAAGAMVFRVGAVTDDPQGFVEALEDQLVRADLVVTSGGVSAGDYDVVKEALRPRGVWFGSVAMQPGKPQGFGRVGPDATPLLALPGNPVSSWVSFQLFVRPVIRRLMGAMPEVAPSRLASLSEPLTSIEGKRQFLRGVVTPLDGSGSAAVAPVVALAGGPGSHLLGDLAIANCLIVVPEDVTSLAAGDEVEVLEFDD